MRATLSPCSASGMAQPKMTSLTSAGSSPGARRSVSAMTAAAISSGRTVRSAPFGAFAFNAVWTEAVNQFPATWHMQPVFAEALNELGAQMMPMMDGEVEVAAGMKAVGDRVGEVNARYQS